MSWWEWYCSLWTGTGLRCDLPWWVLWSILSARGVQRGARILVIDDNPGDLTELLVYRGYDAVGLDPTHRRIVSANTGNAPIRFVNHELVLPEHHFDLIIVRDLDVYRQDLTRAAARTHTASLLSSIKPGGRLTLVIRQKPTWQDRPGGHLRSCFERHLRQFSLKSQIRFLGDGWHRWRTWNWMLGDQPRWGHLIVSTSVPFDLITRDQWQQRVRIDADSTLPACCNWIRRQNSSASNMAARERESHLVSQ